MAMSAQPGRFWQVTVTYHVEVVNDMELREQAFLRLHDGSAEPPWDPNGQDNVEAALTTLIGFDRRLGVDDVLGCRALSESCQAYPESPPPTIPTP